MLHAFCLMVQYIQKEVGLMATLQVRNLPEHIYNKIVELAEEDRRSITQKTIILLEKTLEMKKQNKKHRKKLLNKIIDETKLIGLIKYLTLFHLLERIEIDDNNFIC